MDMGNDKTEIATNVEKMFTIFPRLRERKNRLAVTMSGREQQMLAIGRALKSRPKVMLSDPKARAAYLGE